MKVSVCIIGRDEVDNISKCLDSVIDKVYEVIYVDTGSVDGTKELILEKYPKVKIFNFKWNDSFADARNYSISKAKGDFIFYLDCDEQLILTTPDGKFPETLQEALYNFDILNLTDDNSTVNSICSRMAPSIKGLQFVGSVHEIFSSPKKQLPIIKCEFAHIKHSGYTSKARTEKNKSERNLNMLIKKRVKEGSTVQGCFYEGQEEFILGNFQRNKELAIEGIKLIDQNNMLDKTFESLLYHGWISSLVALNDEEGIADFESKYLEIANNPEVYQALMSYYLNKQNEAKAVLYAYQTLKYINAVQLPAKFIEKNIRFTPYIALAQYFMNIKQDKLMALYWLELVYGSGVDDLKLIIDIYNLLPKGERTLDKWEFYNRKIYEKTNDPGILKDLIGCYCLSKDENKNKIAMNLANDLLNEEELIKLKANLTAMSKSHLIASLK